MTNYHIYRPITFFTIAVVILLAVCGCSDVSEQNVSVAVSQEETIDIAGQWRVLLDRDGMGESQGWYGQPLDGSESVLLPGSLAGNNIGDDINIDTKWTSSLDKEMAFFTDDRYAPYREADNFKFPFFLSPVKYYVGAAWYQRDIVVPAGWDGKRVKLFLERSHWESKVWVDGKLVGMKNSLSTPHVYDLGNLSAGQHRLTIKVDNSIKIEVGNDAHSVGDHTQSNWNGIIGEMLLFSQEDVEIVDVQIYPDLAGGKVVVKLAVENLTGDATMGDISFIAKAMNTNISQHHTIKSARIEKQIENGVGELEFEIPMKGAFEWDEFSPVLYQLDIEIAGDGFSDRSSVTFGYREVAVSGKQITINGRRTMMRGTLECCIFPLTGYPPTDVQSWERIIKIAKSFGLNHFRFHSWCPPRAAFEAADKLGFYYQVEGPFWGYMGQNDKTDKYVYAECDRILKEYGNHPSFVMMAHGNEPWGDNHKSFLSDLVGYWTKKDSRRLFTTGGGWPAVDNNQYHCFYGPRAQRWGGNLKGRFNSTEPDTFLDYTNFVQDNEVPIVSHEVGQWCVYPKFDEIEKYTGNLKAKNFEVFRDFLDQGHMLDQADDFVMASGKLQTICYKEEIEAAFRTPEFGGFQLLDLHDFPGQGTALIGVLDPFWDTKGYVTAEQFRRFCNSTVPLAKMKKLVWKNNETFSADVLVSHFGASPIEDAVFEVKLESGGKTIKTFEISATEVPIGSGTKVGSIECSLDGFSEASQMKLTISIQGTKYSNDWDLWVYPADLIVEKSPKILVAKELNEAALGHLEGGGKVLLGPGPDRIKGDKHGSAPTGFSPIFWNTSYTKEQLPHTLGILCDPEHEALAEFPTKYHSNWQWWYINRSSRAMIMNDLDPKLRPIVQVIDDWFKTRRLGLVFEAKVNGGKLLVTSIDLETEIDNRPVERQMLYSLLEYMKKPSFDPEHEVAVEQINNLFREPSFFEKVKAKVSADSAANGYEASNAIDDNTNTFWHTPWGDNVTSYPHELIIDLKGSREIAGVRYLTRQDGLLNGCIKQYKVYLGEGQNNWGAAVAEGDFAKDNKVKTVFFDKMLKGRYLRFVALNGFGNSKFAAVAELEVIIESD